MITVEKRDKKLSDYPEGVSEYYIIHCHTKSGELLENYIPIKPEAGDSDQMALFVSAFSVMEKALKEVGL